MKHYVFVHQNIALLYGTSVPTLKCVDWSEEVIPGTEQNNRQ